MEKDLQAVADLLGGRKFFYGDDISHVDCVIFGFLLFWLSPFPTPVQAQVFKHPPLLGYYDRCLQELYPENEITSDKIPRAKYP
tara:strand:+ start:176 stop:427 length:252 start_codon:yes stop_codon:yes gene_type:complete